MRENVESVLRCVHTLRMFKGYQHLKIVITDSSRKVVFEAVKQSGTHQ